MAATAGSQQLIHQLLKAEQEAETYITRARENRVKKLREAKMAADEELASYRVKEEERFNREYQNMTGTSAEEKSADEAAKEKMEKVRSDFMANRARTQQYIVDKVLSVVPELSQAQGRM